MIAIIDYGMGNIHSVQKALETLGAKTRVSRKPQDLKKADKIVLPGVGAFDDAMRELNSRRLSDALIECLDNGRIFLGICLGMQLLFESSQESEGVRGLALLRGRVRRFRNRSGFKVPHMGWNQVRIKNDACPLLPGVKDKEYVYFCHSFYPAPRDKKIMAATCDYIDDFPCIIWKDNIFGVQFHPEKSQKTGLKILKNFVKL